MTTLWSVSVCLLASTCAACASRPAHIERVTASAYSTPLEASLGRAAAQAGSAHERESGFYVLDSGRDAFRARLALVEAAERSIDLQYYIWNSDVSGRYLAARILTAAERGVRVRILLDDVNTGDRDAVLAALDAHPQIEVRLYNPLPRGGAMRWLRIMGDFAKVNRRMHNKSLSVDGAATIVGGRNIGDEYFDASDELNFRDRDLLAVGTVVEQVGHAFDTFWNSDWAQPIAALTSEKVSGTGLDSRRAHAAESADTLQQRGYRLPQDPAQGRANFQSILQQLLWAPARLVVDDPPTPDDLQQDDSAKQVAIALREMASSAQHEVLIESAYLIAGDPALDLLSQLHGRSVRLRALTNSLASNDLATNHSGYARRREQMLRAGLELYELRPDAASCRTLTDDSCAHGAAFGLHSKSVVFDRRFVYVGSFNLNLRSVLLNTETALIIDSPELAEQVAASIEENMRPDNSWQVGFDEGGHLRWRTQRNGRIEETAKEPQTSWWRRTVVSFYSLFPLEKYL